MAGFYIWKTRNVWTFLERMHFSFFFMFFVLLFCFAFSFFFFFFFLLFFEEEAHFCNNMSLFCIFQSCVHYWEVNLYKSKSAGPALLTNRCPILLFIFRGTSLRISYGDLSFRAKVSGPKKHPLFRMFVI